MDQITTYYSRGKFEECIGKLENLLKNDSGLEENLLRKSNLNVCQALLAIATDDAEKLEELQDVFYLFYQNITSLGTLGKNVPLRLELTAEYNFFWWILQYNNNDNLDEAEIEQCLQIVNLSLLRLLEKDHIPRVNTNTFVEIISNIKSLVNKIHSRFLEEGNLVAEIVTILILYILKLSDVEIIQQITDLIQQILPRIKSLPKSSRNFSNVFKFSISKINANLDESEPMVDYLILAQAACLFRLNKQKECFEVLQNNPEVKEKNLWWYLRALNAFVLEDYDQSLAILLSATSPIIDRMKCRYYILQGRLYSRNDGHTEALSCFGKAKEASPETLAVYYYLGEEYGKMGLGDMVVESFEELTRNLGVKTNNGSSKFCDIILNLIHPEDEISEAEGLYALACAYGLDERYQQAADTYEKLLQQNSFEFPNTNRILATPNPLIIYHEAATMNLLIGDLIRSQQLIQDAFEKYTPKDRKPKKTEIHIKDVKWLQNLINDQLQLGETLNEQEIRDLTIFHEENLHFFDEDLIGLLILAEIQRIQENEDYKITLTKIYSIMSMHLAKMQKRQDLTEEEKNSLILAKALAAKICLNVAKLQMKSKSSVEVDKTFKRALSCNQGDKDVLYCYAEFFLANGKVNEAGKLWKSFAKKESTVALDQCQSLALRHLLNMNVSKRELGKMETDVELAILGTDLNI